MRIRESIGRRLKSRLGVATALAAVVMLAPLAVSAGGRAGGGGQPTRSGEDFEWRGHIATDKAIEVKGVNGGIVAEPTTGSEVEVVAHKKARKSDPEEVRIEVIEHPGGVTICALYPSPRGAPPNECKPGEGGRMNTHDNDVQVEYTVRVPAGVRFVGRTVNGSVEARGLRADAEAHTVNGSVGISTRGVARASTVNGSIDAEMGTVLREPLEFETVNGGITLVLPADSGAELRASTVNGDILTDLPITVRGRFNHRRVSGTIGRGGPQLMLSTVNGNIRLRTAS
jgi:hypothetical protein